LSTYYIDTTTKLKWECKRGHVWKAIPSGVKRGHWCPECSRIDRTRVTIEEMREMATAREGKCLSMKYVNPHTKLQWKCKAGHIWKSSPHNMKSQGTWCPVCAHIKSANSLKLTIEEMQKRAREKGGECLSKKYVDIHTKLKWMCNKGHTWKAKPMYIKKGTWCPTCAHIKLIDSLRLTIEEMQAIAGEKGGECLSNEYVDIHTKLKWMCNKGHTWKAKPLYIKKGTWCPTCGHIRTSDSHRLTIEEMQAIAREKGGECLSEKYVDCNTKLKWRCSKGHEWEARPSSARRGHWCPICAGKREK